MTFDLKYATSNNNSNGMDIIMTQSTSDRMAMIRAAAKKFQASKNKEARFVRQERAAKPNPKPSTSFLDDSSKDERYYTDASKYANEWYGETYRETTKHDNDWG